MDKFGTARPTWSKLSDPTPRDQAGDSTNGQENASQGNEQFTSPDEILLGMHAGADQRAEELADELIKCKLSNTGFINEEDRDDAQALADELIHLETSYSDFENEEDREHFEKKYVCY